METQPLFIATVSRNVSRNAQHMEAADHPKQNIICFIFFSKSVPVYKTNKCRERVVG